MFRIAAFFVPSSPPRTTKTRERTYGFLTGSVVPKQSCHAPVKKAKIHSRRSDSSTQSLAIPSKCRVRNIRKRKKHRRHTAHNKNLRLISPPIDLLSLLFSFIFIIFPFFLFSFFSAVFKTFVLRHSFLSLGEQNESCQSHASPFFSFPIIPISAMLYPVS